MSLFSSEVSKIGDLCSKLVLRALQISETEKTALILSKLVTDNEQLSENIKRCVWTNIFTLLTSQDINNLPLDLQTLVSNYPIIYILNKKMFLV